MIIEPALIVNESISELRVCVGLSGEIQRSIDVMLLTMDVTAVGKCTSAVGISVHLSADVSLF